MLAMDTHVKIVGVLYIVFGALGTLGALALMLVFGGAATAVGTTAEPGDAAIALPIIGLAGAGLVTFLLVLSLPGIIVGIGLLRYRPWARIAGIVLAVLNLINFPFGTVVAIYALWVLFHNETERRFRAPAVVA